MRWSEIYVIPCYERFVKIWNLVFLLENFVMCVYESIEVFYSKIFVMCVYESIAALKLALGYQIALEAKW